MKILILNGPNLNLLGIRDTDVYGDRSFEDFFEELKGSFDGELTFLQSNHEGELIDAIQRTDADGIIINAGGFTHTSVAIRDAIDAVITPVVEVHISNIAGRESFRHNSMISPVCEGCIFGFGLTSYKLALDYFVNRR